MQRLELAGILVWLLGSVCTTGRISLAAPTLLIVGLHVAALMLYGVIGSRRIPVIVASALLLGGLLWSLFRLNVWLIPLSGGVLLISSTLLVETRREVAEQWTIALLTRWRQWR